MIRYIFTLSTAASAGSRLLRLDLQQNDKITDTQHNIANVIFESFYVSTFNVVSVPDFTTIVSVSKRGSIAEVSLSNNLLTNIPAGEDIIFYDHLDSLNKIKLGFASTPVPKIEQRQQLIDIVTGDTLVDADGSPLVTDALVSVRELANSDNAASLVLNAESISRITEKFPEFSDVSRTLLGVSRDEQQLGLFSDVSILGVDSDVWEKKVSTRIGEYGPWGTRRTASYGRHYFANLGEASEEQALVLQTFPTPYAYPWQPPNYRYSPSQFTKFKTFIELGNELYTYFYNNKSIYGSEFCNNFLDRTKVSIGAVNVTDVNDVSTGVTLQNQLLMNNISEEEGMLLIDIWTTTFFDINEGKFLNPTTNLPFTIDFLTDKIADQISDPDPFNNGVPGYEVGNQKEEVILDSKRTFRYQPGRISGFTFGVRASMDPGSENNVIEWGAYNPTDQYLFQVRGANINIVRRSTIPLPEAIVKEYGVEQTTSLFVDPITKLERTLYEIIIPRSSWNVDSLDGNGPSKYLLNTAQVTMYKIEFSWYGAIGVNFYAYIPVANNEARWVRLNRIVIENRMSTVCLEDPFFKFRYKLSVVDSSKIRSPQHIFKYGASYYIDGKDKGNYTFNTITSNTKSTTYNANNILLGLYPKPTIQSNAGTSKKNKKLILPETITVTSTSQLNKLDIVHCKACPGFGYTYDMGLSAKDTLSKYVQFYFDNVESTNGKVKFRTRYEYPIHNISSTSENISITAVEFPDRVKDGSKFRFFTDVGVIDNITYTVTDIIKSLNTITFNVSSSSGELPIMSDYDTSRIIFLDQLLTIQDHNSKIITEGLYGFYIDMISITEDIDVNRVLEDGTISFYDTAYLLKTTDSRVKLPPYNLSNRSAYNWTLEEGSTPALSGGFSQTRNGTNTTKLINLKYFKLEDDNTIRYYPKLAVLSNPKINMAASNYPIESPKTVIQFLNPKHRYSNKHVGDFNIGVTTRKPVYDNNGELKFQYEDSIKELEDVDLLYVEHISNRIDMTSNFDNSEVIDRGRERFDIDINIPIIPSIDNAGGACSKIAIEIPEVLDVSDCTILMGQSITYNNKPNDIESEKYYIITSNNSFNIEDITLKGGEMGIDGASSGILFNSEIKSFISTVDSVNTTYYYAEVSAEEEITAPFELNFTFVELRYPTGQGELQNGAKRKLFKFNPFPLYLVVQMTDRVKVNSLNLKQIYPSGQETISPTWLHTDGVVLDGVNGKVVEGSFPENFISKNNLDATSYDITSNRRLRDEIKDVKASFYIGADNEAKTTKINLNSIYGDDKSIITQDTFGIDAVFFTARNIRNNNTANSTQLTINVSEQ